MYECLKNIPILGFVSNDKFILIKQTYGSEMATTKFSA